jgi:hypothetical protein
MISSYSYNILLDLSYYNDSSILSCNSDLLSLSLLIHCCYYHIILSGHPSLYQYLRQGIHVWLLRKIHWSLMARLLSIGPDCQCHKIHFRPWCCKYHCHVICRHFLVVLIIYLQCIACRCCSRYRLYHLILIGIWNHYFLRDCLGSLLNLLYVLILFSRIGCFLYHKTPYIYIILYFIFINLLLLLLLLL